MSYAPPQQQQAETETVTGQVVGILQKGPDKWQVQAMPQGSQYPRNLWTKDAALVQQMSQSIGQWFDFICGISHWQRQDGQQVRSLWVNGVAVAGTTAQAQGGYPAQQPPPQAQSQWQPPVQGQPAQWQQPQAQPQQQAPPPTRTSDDVREDRIHRQSAMKVVALMLPYMEPSERNAQGMIAVSEGLVRYFKHGPVGLGQQQASPQQQDGQYENTPPPQDDDYGGQQPEEYVPGEWPR